MTRQRRMSEAELARERALHVYAAALLQGDLETMGRILRLAEEDPVLARQVEELEAEDEARFPELALAGDAEEVRRLLLQHLPSAQGTDDPEPPALTVGDVVSKLLVERRVAPADQAAAEALRRKDVPVPARVGWKDVRRLGQALGVQASEAFWRCFREAALLLGLSQSQQAGFAAARRHRGGQAAQGRQDGAASQGKKDDEDR